MAKERALSEASVAALEALRNAGRALTLAELKEVEGLENLNSSNLTALVNRELVSAEKVTKEVVTVVKRKVNSYSATAVETETAETE